LGASKVISLRRAILRAEEGAEIWAKPPFTPESNAIFVELSVEGFAPDGFEESAERRGLQRFLDADSVNEVLDAASEVQITKDQLVELVIHYAEHREYPNWFHELEVKD
jgi:hypothetical protein